MRVGYACLPALPSLQEVTVRRAELGRREVHEWADPRWHLEAAHLRMVRRDRAFVELVACCRAGYLDVAEVALRRWLEQTDALRRSVAAAGDLARARQVEHRPTAAGVEGRQ
jgi:hypothetical protein